MIRPGAIIGLAAMSLTGCATPFEGAPLQDAYAIAAIDYRLDGKFRRDVVPTDAPLSEAMIVRNFMKVALETEPQQLADGTSTEGGDIPLTRWRGPVSYAFYPASDTPEDRARIAELAARIGRLTKLDIRETNDATDSDIGVFIFDGNERSGFVDAFSALGGPGSFGFLRTWRVDPRYPCIGKLAVNEETGEISKAMILIKNELRGDFREACLTEEFVQTLGLMNDDFDVRPSIFNDDQEFIELTKHDEYLLRVLYDPRLRAGMSRVEAEPIVREIVRDLPGLEP